MNKIEVGMRYELTQKVEQKDTAKAYGSGLVEVFATPAMIALMEKTALNVVHKALEDGQNTVGTEVSVKHVKATPVGMQVRCTAVLIANEGAKLTFEVEAYDEKGLIGKGIHKRYIINEAGFMQQLQS